MTLRRILVNGVSLLILAAGSARLHAQITQPVVQACCRSGFGQACCGTVCFAGLFTCEAY